MKNFLLVLFISSFTFTFSQEKVLYKKASDTANLPPREVIIPDDVDDVYNENYSLFENGQAFEKGSYILSEKRYGEFDGFYFQIFNIENKLVYTPGYKITPKAKEVKNPSSNKRFAWIAIVMTFLYFCIFSYFLKKGIKFLLALALAPVALAVALELAVAVAVAPALALALVLVLALAVALELAAMKYFYIMWVILNILGMTMVAYFFTPLFLVSTVLGISAGYSIYILNKKRKK